MEYAMNNTDTGVVLSKSSVIPKAVSKEPSSSSYVKDGRIITLKDPYQLCYLEATQKIDLSGIPEFEKVGSVSDEDQTLIFSEELEKREVPSSWLTWSEPPYSESSTPQVLYNSSNELTITLINPSRVFGLEIEPNSFGTYGIDVEFYGQGELLGKISRYVSGRGGARLFAAAYSYIPFDTIRVVAQQGSNGFAIAQLRYGFGLSCELYCENERCIPFETEICTNNKILKTRCPQLKDYELDIIFEEGKCYAKPKCNINVCNKSICLDIPCVPVDIVYINGKAKLVLCIDVLEACQCSGCKECTYTGVAEIDIHQAYVQCNNYSCENIKLILKDIQSYVIECNCKIIIKGIVEIVCCDK